MQTNKQKLFNYLKSQRLMALATFDRNPWICTVYYVMDDNFNLYFVSDPATKHCQAITKNSKVSCDIFDSHQKVTDKKVGAQVRGTASLVKNTEKLKWALKFWNKLNPGISHIINFNNIKKRVIKSNVYKVKPEIIQFFNEALYGEAETELFTFS